jgi:hypothetical protein
MALIVSTLRFSFRARTNTPHSRTSIVVVEPVSQSIQPRARQRNTHRPRNKHRLQSNHRLRWTAHSIYQTGRAARHNPRAHALADSLSFQTRAPACHTTPPHMAHPTPMSTHPTIPHPTVCSHLLASSPAPTPPLPTRAPGGRKMADVRTPLTHMHPHTHTHTYRHTHTHVPGQTPSSRCLGEGDKPNALLSSAPCYAGGGDLRTPTDDLAASAQPKNGSGSKPSRHYRTRLACLIMPTSQPRSQTTHPLSESSHALACSLALSPPPHLGTPTPRCATSCARTTLVLPRGRYPRCRRR